MVYRHFSLYAPGQTSPDLNVVSLKGPLREGGVVAAEVARSRKAPTASGQETLR